jgi:hypothetical protein
MGWFDLICLAIFVAGCVVLLGMAMTGNPELASSLAQMF